MNSKTIVLYRMVMFLPLLMCSCATMGIEKLEYTVLEKDGSIEIRQYKPYRVAETLVEADFDKAGNIAFRRLFNYISGNNRTQKSIAMTAPVKQRPQSEKIAMTAPVTQQAAGGQYAVSFVMPAQYTMETLPEPIDPNVVIKEVTGFKAAAIRYSGTWSQKRYEAKKTTLEAFIKNRNLTATAEATFARYDPPFQLWFLRRNEVIIPVE